MRKLRFAAVILFLASSVAADEAAPRPLDARTAELVRGSVPVCANEVTLSQAPFDRTFSSGMKPVLVRIDSKDDVCRSEVLVITTAKGNVFVGRPWLLEKYEGTLEAKLKSFAWEALHETIEPVVSADRDSEGLRRVALLQQTEFGKIPIRGVVDAEGKTFYPGSFAPLKDDLKASRNLTIGPLIAASPTRGPATAKLSLVEFSDFQCPSCRRSATFMKPILAKYGDRIRYTRFDLPLTSHHPWAFSAAIAGRAVYRQNPELFWKYKEAIYDNQENLNAFTVAEFARGFAQDHELDLTRYDADVVSPQLRQQILDGVGASFSLQLFGTPSFLVNGTLVDAGLEGAALDRYIAAQLGTLTAASAR